MTAYKIHKLKPTSLTTYEKWLNAHILPSFGERSIASITTDDIQQFLNERKDMSGKSLTVMRNLMGEIFKDAAEDGLIEKDPSATRFRFRHLRRSCRTFMNGRMRSAVCSRF